MLCGQLLYRTSLRRHLSGATHNAWTTDQSVSYIRDVFADYCTYGRVFEWNIEGANVLEVGPGDNLGVALQFYAAGAREVTCVDRFQLPQTAPTTERVYEQVVRELDGAAATRAKDVLRAGACTLEPAVRHLQAPIEGLEQLLGEEKFDLILSRAVLEHVANLDQAWSSMVRLLKPGGVMLHKVDLRNHSLFADLHPLYWMTIGEAQWRWLSAPDPTLNRRLWPDYRELTATWQLESHTWITHILDHEECVPHLLPNELAGHYEPGDIDRVEQIRDRLLPRYRNLDVEDLMVSGIFVVVRKPSR